MAFLAGFISSLGRLFFLYPVNPGVTRMAKV